MVGVFARIQLNTILTWIAHPIDIFSLAVTDSQILSASGASSLKVYSTADADFPLAQSIDGAHKVGCHHIVTNPSGSKAVSVGFGGEVKVWSHRNGSWYEDNVISGKAMNSESLDYLSLTLPENAAKSAEIWAPALSENGQYLAGVSQDGHIKVWDLDASGEQIQDYETKGSFGTCLDIVRP